MSEEIKLPPKTLDDIRSGVKLSKELDKFLNKAEIAGEDVRAKRQIVADKRERFMKMKQAFYPNDSL